MGGGWGQFCDGAVLLKAKRSNRKGKYLVHEEQISKFFSFAFVYFTISFVYFTIFIMWVGGGVNFCDGAVLLKAKRSNRKGKYLVHEEQISKFFSFNS